MRNLSLNVTLLDFTGAGLDPENAGKYAAAMLVFAKETRLSMQPNGFREFLDMDYSELLSRLDYISKTIPASWEFIHLTFCVENVTRACIQQITRTRFVPAETDIFGSYAAQSQRVTDMSAAGFRLPPSLAENPSARLLMAQQVDQVMETYQWLIDNGELPEDARAILPMNLQSNIIISYNLRQFIDVVKARQSLRAQDEYRELAEQMVASVEAVYPWIGLFLRSRYDSAVEIIETEAKKLDTDGKRALAKAADLLRKA